MDEFEYKFNNGLQMKIVLGEDGYTVNTWGVGQSKMGTFTNFKNLLYGISGVCQDNLEDQFEMATFTSNLWLKFQPLDNDAAKMDLNKVVELLME